MWNKVSMGMHYKRKNMMMMMMVVTDKRILSGFSISLALYIFEFINGGESPHIGSLGLMSCSDGFPLHIPPLSTYHSVVSPKRSTADSQQPMEPHQMRLKQRLNRGKFIPIEKCWNIRNPNRIDLLRTKGALLDNIYMRMIPLSIFHHYTLR